MSAFLINPFVFFLIVFVLCTQKSDAYIGAVRKLCSDVLRIYFIGNFLFDNFYDYHGLKISSKLVAGLKYCKCHFKIGL